MQANRYKQIQTNTQNKQPQANRSTKINRRDTQMQTPTRSRTRPSATSIPPAPSLPTTTTATISSSRGQLKFEALDLEHIISTSAGPSTEQTCSSSSVSSFGSGSVSSLGVGSKHVQTTSSQPGGGLFSALSAATAVCSASPARDSFATKQTNSTTSSSMTSSTSNGSRVQTAETTQQPTTNTQYTMNSSSFRRTSLAGASYTNDAMETERPEPSGAESRKLRLQIYVFVLRCIAYPYNARPINIDELALSRQQQLRLTRQHLETILANHTRYVQQQTSQKKYPHQHLTKLVPRQQSNFKLLDETYDRIQFVFNRKMLSNNKPLERLIEFNACSVLDIKELFRSFSDKLLRQYELKTSLAQLFKDEPSCRDIILNSWTSKFESIMRGVTPLDSSNQTFGPLCSASASATSSSSQNVTTLQQQFQLQQQQQTSQLNNSSQTQQQQLQQQLSKDHLYQMFQTILNIKKFEHQLLFNALQLDSADEQAAAVRRELDNRIQLIAELERNKKLLMPKFVLKEMESLYIDEARAFVQQLMINLDKLPVSKSQSESRYGLQKFRRNYQSQR